MHRKGIILAGGSGSRLFPMTRVVSKQLLPVYDKPLVYYPLGTLMSGGFREILIISTPQHLPQFKELLGDGSQWGLHLSYAEQARPEGLGQALIIAEDFLNGHDSVLILGDNIFHGPRLIENMRLADTRRTGCTIFAYRMDHPERYGVVEIDSGGQAVSLEEKPTNPRSPYAVTGIYFYDATAVSAAKQLEPSSRGEIEITDLNRYYLNRGDLSVVLLDQGTTWLDTGTHASLMQAAKFVQTVENANGIKIGCVEEIAYRHGWIDGNQLNALASQLAGTDYGNYLNIIVGSTIDSRMDSAMELSGERTADETR